MGQSGEGFMWVDGRPTPTHVAAKRQTPAGPASVCRAEEIRYDYDITAPVRGGDDADGSGCSLRG